MTDTEIVNAIVDYGFPHDLWEIAELIRWIVEVRDESPDASPTT